jgi:hypothetical protein
VNRVVCNSLADGLGGVVVGGGGIDRRKVVGIESLQQNRFVVVLGGVAAKIKAKQVDLESECCTLFINIENKQNAHIHIYKHI